MILCFYGLGFHFLSANKAGINPKFFIFYPRKIVYKNNWKITYKAFLKKNFFRKSNPVGNISGNNQTSNIPSKKTNLKSTKLYTTKESLQLAKDNEDLTKIQFNVEMKENDWKCLIIWENQCWREYHYPWNEDKKGFNVKWCFH